MKYDSLGANTLSLKMIPNTDEDLVKELNLPQGHRSIGITTTDCDDVTYTAPDEATKKAEVKTVYTTSFYGGAGNVNTELAGEVIGTISGPSPAEVRSGLNTVVEFVESGISSKSANEDDTVVYYAHCISRAGSYLSEQCNIQEGAALAYCIAPPIESVYALDVALKAADIELVQFYGPPSETNLGGGLLTGSQSAYKIAYDALEDAVIAVADQPTNFWFEVIKCKKAF